MSFRRPPATVVLAALAAIAATACASQPATAPAAASAPAAAPAAAATPAVVERPAAFAVCAACHGTTADAPPSLGPNLFGVAGKKAGSVPGYDYSDAMKASTIVWTPENLAAFVADPAKVIPDNNMDFPGVSDSDADKAIAAYLASLH
ncbi:MAG: c-type cytochrome [Alphaproteobacteria bacterium]|nr:c-type cytochrome [Alphaproteobacteria bacterium]